MKLRAGIFSLALFMAASAGAQNQITYRVQPLSADERNLAARVRVEIALPPSIPPGPLTVVMPRAIPMGYGEQPYDRFVENVRAFGGTEALPVERAEGPRWLVGMSGFRVSRITYEVDVARMEREVLAASDTSKARPGYLALLGYSIFAFIEGMEEAALELELLPPENRKGWRAVSTLAPEATSNGERRAGAANFYALADSQIVFGPAAQLTRVAAPRPLFVLVYAETEADAQRCATLAKETMESLIRYFGSAPFPHFTVLQEYIKPLSAEHRYNFSMEHMDSVTAVMDVASVLAPGASEQEAGRVRYNLAHHFAHAWIPKRAYGEGYFPFNWEFTPVLDTIWFSEGFGQYMALDALADDLPAAEGAAYRERVMERRFRSTIAAMPESIRRMSLVELSRVASTRYSEDFRTGRSVFSRGAMMAYEMDMAIRKATGGKKRLRDALRGLMVWSARERRGFRIEELPRIFEDATGVNTREILEKWLKPMPAISATTPG